MTECRLCKSKKIRLIKHGVRDNSDIDVYKCQKCGLEFLSQFNQADEQFYTNGQMHSTYEVDCWLNHTQIDDKRRVKSLLPLIKNKKVLDFGTGNGGFLIYSKDIVESVVGYEIDSSLREHYEKHNLSVEQNLDFLKDKFDVITMFHVLEHIKEPENVLKNLKKYFNKKGRLIIEVPNSNDALLTIYKNEAFKNYTYWSCHLFVYNATNLKTILKNSGYKIKKINYVQRFPYTNHIGWIKNKKPGGHGIYHLNKYLNILYTLILKILHKTDTIVVVAEPIL